MDQAIAQWWAAHQIAWLTPYVAAWSALFAPACVFLYAGALALWRRRWELLALPLVVSGLSRVIKLTIGRERPNGGELSFPSGHSAAAVAFAVVVARAYPPAAALAWANAFIVGFTRLYLGVHWTSDVIAGWLLGIVTTVTGLHFCGRRVKESP